jgi:hypothetical protein
MACHVNRDAFLSETARSGKCPVEIWIREKGGSAASAVRHVSLTLANTNQPCTDFFGGASCPRMAAVAREYVHPVFGERTDSIHPIALTNEMTRTRKLSAPKPARGTPRLPRAPPSAHRDPDRRGQLLENLDVKQAHRRKHYRLQPYRCLAHEQGGSVVTPTLTASFLDVFFAP